MCPRDIMSLNYNIFNILHTLIPRAMQEKPRAVLTMDRREDIIRMGTPRMPHMVGM